MNEEQQTQFNSVFDQLILRLTKEIQRSTLKELEHVVHIVLQMMDFKQHAQSAEAMNSKSEQMLGEVVKMMKKSNMGGPGPMPGTIFPPSEL